jgi:hypothetical protein
VVCCGLSKGCRLGAQGSEEGCVRDGLRLTPKVCFPITLCLHRQFLISMVNSAVASSLMQKHFCTFQIISLSLS